ncbi:MAG: dethiobiotin synthase [Desulfonatronovibrio sp. MSAO_Bac4]|nr:MAG: dethiobiotin synthase [Desulfonatronovibrio sp. MSAO_Bac4]
MKYDFPDNFFVTGTDTGVGKTFICALLTCGLEAGYWKPVQSGSVDGLDSDFVCRASGMDKDRIIPERYVFKKPLSPHLAAAHENTEIELDEISLPSCSFPLIVEGAGGVLVPLNRRIQIIHLIKKLDLSCIIVASHRLGVINHTLLTLQALYRADVQVAGVILNNGINHDHKEAIEYYGNVRVLAQVERMDKVSPENMKKKFNELFL